MVTSILMFFRRKQNWPILVIPVLLLIWAQFVAPSIGAASFENVALFQSPYRDPVPVGKPGQPVTSHVVIIVVDGLRLDLSRQMPTINQLRGQGADRMLLVGQPSFSLPGWTVIGTGAWQEQSGITTNFAKDSIKLDTIFLDAKQAGLSTALVGDEPWGQLYATGVDVKRLKPEDADEYTNLDGDLKFDTDTADLALDVLKNQPNLMLIHLLSVDSAAHGWGAASPQELKVVQNADAQIARILSALDLKDTTVFVTADHGHLDRGGHGGWEQIVLEVPFVAAGKGIKPGQYGTGSQADIAPTVAALLGTAIPAHNQGTILFDELDMPDSVKAARAVDLTNEIAQRYNAMLQVIDDSRQVDPQLVSAVQISSGTDTLNLTQQAIDGARNLWATARQDRLNRERLVRFGIALILVILAILYLWWWRRERWNWRVPLIGALLYFVLWYAVYFIIDKSWYSLSMFDTEANIRNFITGRVIEALIALTVAVIVVALIRRRAGFGEIARDILHTMLLVAMGLGVQMLVFYVLWGISFSWYLPDLMLGFKFYLDLYQTTVFWPMLVVPAAILLPLIALLVAWVANRIRPVRA